MTKPDDTSRPSDPRWEQLRGFGLDSNLEIELRDYLYQLDIDINIETQLIAVYGLLAKTKEADEAITKEIREREEQLKTITDDEAQRYAEGGWIDCLHQATYHGAAHSMAALGMLAPLLETVFHQYLRAICQKLTELGAPPSGHARWSGAQERAFDCHWAWDPTAARLKERGLVVGIEDIVDALGLAQYLPADYKQVLDALFLYRNKMFHHGFEWPMGKRRAFEQAMREKEIPTEWFTKATSGDDPVVFYMSEPMISKVMATIDAVLDGIAGYARDRVTPLRLKQEYP